MFTELFDINNNCVDMYNIYTKPNLQVEVVNCVKATQVLVTNVIKYKEFVPHQRCKNVDSFALFQNFSILFTFVDFLCVIQRQSKYPIASWSAISPFVDVRSPQELLNLYNGLNAGLNNFIYNPNYVVQNPPFNIITEAIKYTVNAVQPKLELQNAVQHFYTNINKLSFEKFSPLTSEILTTSKLPAVRAYQLTNQQDNWQRQNVFLKTPPFEWRIYPLGFHAYDNRKYASLLQELLNFVDYKFNKTAFNNDWANKKKTSLQITPFNRTNSWYTKNLISFEKSNIEYLFNKLSVYNKNNIIQNNTTWPIQKAELTATLTINPAVFKNTPEILRSTAIEFYFTDINCSNKIGQYKIHSTFLELPNSQLVTNYLDRQKFQYKKNYLEKIAILYAYQMDKLGGLNSAYWAWISTDWLDLFDAPVNQLKKNYCAALIEKTKNIVITEPTNLNYKCSRCTIECVSIVV